MNKQHWLGIAAVMLLAGGIELKLVAYSAEPQAGANASGSRPSSPQHDKAVKTLLETARNTWDETAREYDNGRVTLAEVYAWSRRLLDAERMAAADKGGEIDALMRHWKRMQVLHNKIQALFDAAARGGEAQKLHATSFYVAEAELWLVDAGGQAPGDED